MSAFFDKLFKKYSINGINNKIYLSDNGHLKLCRYKIPNVKISIHGDNNLIIIEKPINFQKINIIVSGNNKRFSIGSTKDPTGLLNIFADYPTSHNTLNIGRDLHVGSANFYLFGNDSHIDIGNDCLFSQNIKIFAGDGHAILSKQTGNTLNNKKYTCHIGNHCWLGMDVIVLKNSYIANNCIVGAASVVSGKFETENIMLVGNPAKHVKSNIDWNITMNY